MAKSKRKKKSASKTSAEPSPLRNVPPVSSTNVGVGPESSSPLVEPKIETLSPEPHVMSDKPSIDLRTHAVEHHGSPTAAPPGKHDKRFDCFLIDTGWNEPVSKVVRSHLPMYFGTSNPDPLYLLTPEQSIAILKLEPHLIGHDPTVVIYDHFPPPEGKTRGKYKGFRLNLGLMKSPQQALSKLQEFVRFVLLHRQSLNLERDVLKELHKEGLDGMVKVLREISEAGIELI